MLLFLNNHYYIPRFNPRILISFTMENISLTIRGSFINFNINNFFLFNHFFTIASFAFVFFVYYLALATTIIARTLWLTIHTGTKHCHFHYLTSSLTSLALLNSSFFTSFTFAFGANSLSIHCYFSRFTAVNFLKSYFQWVFDWLHLLRSLLPASTTHTKHFTQHVIHTMSLPTIF